LSVSMQLNSDEATEKAFEEIAKLTDEELDIES
jgi:hypothetical protein